MNTQQSTHNSQLTVTFLGTGTSQGVPTIGCDCDICRSDDPRDKRLRSSIFVDTPETKFVVDTGTDFRAQVLRENIRRVDAVVFTHSHTDHIMGFDDLRRFSWERGNMPIYASPETMADLARVFEFAFKGLNPFPGYLKPEPHIIEGPFQLGETTLTPLPVPHGNSEVLGFLFERGGKKLVAYLSDCSGVPDDIAAKIRGVEVFIVDGLRPKPHPTHLSVEQAIEAASRVQPARTYLTHIAHELAQRDEANLPPNTYIAFDGLKLTL